MIFDGARELHGGWMLKFAVREFFNESFELCASEGHQIGRLTSNLDKVRVHPMALTSRLPDTERILI